MVETSRQRFSYFDSENIVRLAIEGGCNGVASTLGVLGSVARKYAHKIPFIVKMNRNELLTYGNSCGDRHCPRTKAANVPTGSRNNRQDLLPVEYFHVVFTVPDSLNGVALAHPAEFYHLLFRAARETLLEAAGTLTQGIALG